MRLVTAGSFLADHPSGELIGPRAPLAPKAGVEAGLRATAAVAVVPEFAGRVDVSGLVREVPGSWPVCNGAENVDWLER